MRLVNFAVFRSAARASIVGVGLLCASVAPVCAEVRPAFDLADVLGSPFPSNLVASPTGSTFAWVFNHRGLRNVWVAEGPALEARQVTTFDEDDGQDLGQLAFSPDGRTLVFVRGGPPNAQGELPNPRTFAQGVGSHLWRLTLGSDAELLGEGSQPLFLSSETLAFFRRGTLHSTPIAEYKPEPLLRIRGRVGQPTLSPDAKRLAFVSRRGTHSFVGVLDLESKVVRFLSPGVDSDASPTWSPDSTRVAFRREPTGTGGNIFEPRVEVDEPWSLWVGDASSGEATRVFRAQAGAGSAFRALEGARQIVWTRDGHLIFPWERTGWLHLYAVSISGSAPRALTQGEFEVEHVEPTPDGRGVVFSSNQGHLERRHLWRIASVDSPPEALSGGSGIERIPVPAQQGGAIAYMASDAARPLQPVVLRANGTQRRLAESLYATFPLSSMVEPEAVTFRAADGQSVPGQLFLPPATYAGPRPAAIFFHGGSRRQMLLGWHKSPYYHHCYAFHQYLASRGYVVLSVNYRSGIGYGLHFREAANYGAAGASEFNDVVGAGLYLRGREDVDGDRIGLWGGSYGGYLTALGLARASDLFAAGVDIHGVHDWNRTIKNFVPSYEPLEDPPRARRAFESSPLGSVEGWRSPVLLIHGDDDRNVPFEESIELVDRLRELGVEHELLVFPDEVHGFLLHDSWLRLFGAAERFFERHLGADAAAERAAAAP